jgi:molybdopterin molybdotransferase
VTIRTRTLADALSRIAAAVRPSPAESVPVERAAGRVLARDVYTDVDWPPFDTSAMDGYAVRLADASAGAEIPERPGLVAAGDAPPDPLAPGEAVRIMTGAPLPPGTEAIVPVEKTHRGEGRVRFDAAPSAGAHIRRKGESVAAGSLLLRRGKRLASSDIALAALAGADPLECHRAPRIAVAVTGNEIVRGGQKPAPGRLRDSNGPMLLAECAARGWPARRMAPVADDPAAVSALFAQAGADEDFLVTTGGVSAGDLDLLPAAAEAAGFEILFHGVRMRPGKPIAFGVRDSVWWIGLPGNPVSASIGFRLLGCEALARFEGDASPAPPRATARLQSPLPASGERDRFFDARCLASGGTLLVTPLRSSGSHDLAALARANALVFSPAGTPARAPGDVVEVILLSPLSGPSPADGEPAP